MFGIITGIGFIDNGAIFIEKSACGTVTFDSIWFIRTIAATETREYGNTYQGGNMLRNCAKPMSIILIFSFLLFNFTVQAAKAELISTETVVSLTKNEMSRAKVSAFLERQDMQRILKQQGVDVAEARKQVNALSDAEFMQIAQKIDQLPAGGDGVGTVVGAALIVFLVLLVTDLLGLTHVFSFVNR